MKQATLEQIKAAERAYYERFGHWPPIWVEEEVALQKIEEALATDKPVPGWKENFMLSDSLSPEAIGRLIRKGFKVPVTDELMKYLKKKGLA